MSSQLVLHLTAVYCRCRQEDAMDQGRWNLRGTEEQRQTNGTSRDMPSGFRPCPFCHSLIPWASETCPSCGRVLIERVETTQQPTAQRVLSRSSSWWSRVVAPRIARLRSSIRGTVTHGWHTAPSSPPSDSWSTTTRGTSWSVFQPASRPSRQWWPRGLPQPSDRERVIFLAAAAVMVILFLLLLLGVKH